MTKDWTGNTKSVYSVIGASNHAVDKDREPNDYYATDPIAVDILLEQEEFVPYVWEPACGGGHISDELKAHGFDVFSSDICDRGYVGTQIIDFLKYSNCDRFPRDIITNPPYKYAKEFVEHALDISLNGVKVAMFLKLTFLEGKARKKLFKKYPPKAVYVFSSRVKCAKNGDFDSVGSSAVAYAWFVWQKGYNGETVIKWIN